MRIGANWLPHAWGLYHAGTSKPNTLTSRAFSRGNKACVCGRKSRRQLIDKRKSDRGHSGEEIRSYRLYGYLHVHTSMKQDPELSQLHSRSTYSPVHSFWPRPLSPPHLIAERNEDHFTPAPSASAQL